MKELTIEQKAQRYDEALERARLINNKGTWVRCGSTEPSICEQIFPELAESEDERIRKEIIDLIEEVGEDDSYHVYYFEEMIAWLEKQGKKDEEILILKDQIESLHAAIEALKEIHKIELENQSEPKKHDICDNCEQQGGCVFPCPMKLVEKQGGQKLPIEKLPFEMKTPEESLGIDSGTYSKIVDECVYGEQKSAYTKEYDFHGTKFIPKFAKGDIIKDKKSGEVSTIEDFSYDTGLYTHTYGQFPITIQDNYEIIEQKPCNEEDEMMIKFALTHFRIAGAKEDSYIIKWLKNLKERLTKMQSQS